MDVAPIRAFRDNYIWLLRAGARAAVVDPGDAALVLHTLESEGLRLTAILITHHHNDHIGGIGDLLARFDVPVFGPAAEEIPAVSVKLREPDTVRVPGIDAEFAVLDVPGHTWGHVAYYGANDLFCGDTLFGCGCGRLFEGTASQMWQSLSRLASLPAHTRVFCAHEYTQGNIRFALEVEPDNAALQERARRVEALRAKDEPTVPSTIGEELATNPFLRTAEPAVVAAARRQGGADTAPCGVFAALRKWKDRF